MKKDVYKYDWIDERNSIENLLTEVQDICLIRNLPEKEAKQQILELTGKALIHLDNVDYAFDDMESDYEDRIDELEEEIDNYLEQIDELKGGK